MIFDTEGTIAAPATIPGTGAISMIRVSGKDCLSVVDRVVTFAGGTAEASEGGRIKFGRIYSGEDIVDEVLVAIFRHPHSYTGEDSAEITCHASRYIVEEILRLLCDAGARPAEPGEFTRRAFVNGKMDLAQAEAVADVISASGKASLKVAMNQLRGGYSGKLGEIRGRLVEIAALMELELDFSEEDVEFADRSQLKSLVDDALGHISSLTESFKAGNALKNGIPVVIAGPVNAGKSSLLNVLLGEDRAIVSPVAGTTRDTVEEAISLGGLLFRFIDTAGIRDSGETVEKMGIDRTYRKISEASIVLAMFDISSSPEEISSCLDDLLPHLDFESQKLLILLNKTDILEFNKKVTMTNKIVSLFENKVDAPILTVSAKTEEGIDVLKEKMTETGRKMVTAEGDTVVTNLRHYNALASAHDALARVRRGLDGGLTSDLLSQDLREALWYIGSITGEVTSDEILTTVFQRFCIGK